MLDPRGETSRRRLPFRFRKQAGSLPNLTALIATGLRAGRQQDRHSRLMGTGIQARGQGGKRDLLRFDPKCLVEPTSKRF